MMPLVGIRFYRAVVTRVVYDAGHSRYDTDVSIFDGSRATVEYVDSREHRRSACKARIELWRQIKAGEIDDDDQIQVFEEMSHT